MAAILYPEGSKDIKVGDMVCVVVEEESDVAAFKDFKLGDSPAPSAPAAAAPAAAAPAGRWCRGLRRGPPARPTVAQERAASAARHRPRRRAARWRSSCRLTPSARR